MINDEESRQSEMTNLRPRIEVLDSMDKRRRWTSDEKQRLLAEAEQVGNTISSIARKYGISASQVFNWRKQFQLGGAVAVRANDEVVPATDHKAALNRIRELERQLGKKTMEAEILKEAIQVGREKKLFSRAQLQKADDILGRL
jgi:transposase